MGRPESPKVTRAKELIKDKRLTNRQVAMRSGISERHTRRLRNQMEEEQCK